jgi:hypothetical protein
LMFNQSHKEVIFMTLEKFTKQQNPDRPSVTIRRNGTLGFNQKAIEMFQLEGLRFATLHYDQTESLLGIKPEKDGDDPSIFRLLREKNRTLVISCQSFLKHCQIPYKDGSKTYPVGWDEKREMILVNIV